MSRLAQNRVVEQNVDLVLSVVVVAVVVHVPIAVVSHPVVSAYVVTVLRVFPLICRRHVA